MQLSVNGYISRSNTVCPVCKKEPLFTVNCPKEDALICMSHCYECIYINDQISVTHCDYRRGSSEHERTV